GQPYNQACPSGRPKTRQSYQDWFHSLRGKARCWSWQSYGVWFRVQQTEGAQRGREVRPTGQASERNHRVRENPQSRSQRSDRHEHGRRSACPCGGEREGGGMLPERWRRVRFTRFHGEGDRDVQEAQQAEVVHRLRVASRGTVYATGSVQRRARAVSASRGRFLAVGTAGSGGQDFRENA